MTMRQLSSENHSAVHTETVDETLWHLEWVEAAMPLPTAQLILPEEEMMYCVAEPANPFYLSYGGFSLFGEAGSVAEQTEISVTGLQSGELPAIDPWLINVTGPFDGYRLLPHTPQFPKELTLSIPYDPEKIPTGYSPFDIRTFYYNVDKRKVGHGAIRQCRCC
jgi:hypothetical protein